MLADPPLTDTPLTDTPLTDTLTDALTDALTDTPLTDTYIHRQSYTLTHTDTLSHSNTHTHTLTHTHTHFSGLDVVLVKGGPSMEGICSLPVSCAEIILTPTQLT